jgi:hypothetical protein
MRRFRYLGTILVGALLAAAPFLRYSAVGGLGEAHRNHEARHGGQLGMVGDHHLELVRRAGEVEVYLSDAWRRPLVPVAGQLVFDRVHPTELRWVGHRLVGADRADARTVEATVVLDDGTRLALGFDLDPP